MKKIVFLLIIFLISNKSFGDDYSATLLSESLKENANAIIRVDSTYMKLENNGFVIKKKFVITVLNKEADIFSIFKERYSNFNKISSLSAILYNADGKKIKSAKSSEFVDISAFGTSFAFYEDDRYKILNFNHKEYPYTVKYEWEERSKSLFLIPIWVPQIFHSIAVEKAILEIEYFENMIINLNPINFPDTFEFSAKRFDNIVKQNKWVYKNIKPFKTEPYAESYFRHLPRFNITVGDVNLNEFKGSMKTWSSLGSFIQDINKGKDELSNEQQVYFQKMVQNSSKDEEKIALLYKYLQDNTRYVLNSKGILGWQSISAQDVQRLGYGDCKGLSNYMKGILNAVGIKSFLTVVNAGDQNNYNIDPNFPQNIFNHMILCVPLVNDTIWLECTSSNNSMGYLGDFTQDRNVLVLDENGGSIVRTPSYNSEKDYKKLNVVIDLNVEEKNQTIHWNALYSGPIQDGITTDLKQLKPSEFSKRALHSVPYKNVTVVEYDYDWSNINKTPLLKEQLQLNVEGIINETPSRFLVSLPFAEIYLPNIETKEERKLPFVFNDEYSYNFNYKIKIPSELKLETIPKNIDYIFSFGHFSIQYKFEKDVLEAVVYFICKKGAFPASQYKNYMDFANNIQKYNKTLSLSLLKK